MLPGNSGRNNANKKENIMKYDVFLCHSSKDKSIADSICRLLEANGVTCWIAPRNVRPGSHYAEEIVDAIDSSLSILLILSENSNTSVHVRNELDLGVSRGKVIFPVLIENIKPSKALIYYISTSQWVEAWIPPLEKKIIELAEVINILSGRAGKKSKPPVPIKVEAERADTKSNFPEVPVEEVPVYSRVRSFDTQATPINASFSSDGKKIIAGIRGIIGKPPTGKSPVFSIFDVGSGLKIIEKPVHTAGIPIFMELSPDLQTAMIADSWKIVLLNAGNGELLSEFQIEGVKCASFLKDSSHAITGGKELLIWDLNLKNPVVRLRGQTGYIRSLAVSPDATRAFTSEENGTVRFWNLRENNMIWSIDRYKKAFSGMKISSDGKQLLAGNNERICLIDLITGEEILNFPGHKGCQCIAISADGEKALSGGTDNSVYLYDLKKQTVIHEFLTTGSWTGSVGFSPDGRYLFSCDMNNINIWSIKT